MASKPATARASAISVKDVSSAVAKAVHDLGDQGKVLEQDFVLNHIIMGRILRESIQLQEAEQLAEKIAQKVAVPAGHAVASAAAHAPSGIFGTGGHIIIGIILNPQITLRE